ncbi:putative RING-H2 finger protein ATL21A [Trifolium pratense]|uniref:putative RING-H2 finger protein ATL21A n=1 Tax=Trifolium pratense TaxID=57577 RepID=UPI001E6952CA|nr:putative RING-H2 finger protein ATL21A [Trifolium pratense]
MGILKVLLYLIFPVIHALNDCPVSLCGNFSLPIRFPFILKGEQSPYCGYPGFNLICSNQRKSSVLELPYSGKFYVRNINYLTQQIQLYDPDNCLPKRLLSLNFSNSPFIATFSRDYTFLSCSSQNISQNLGSQFIPIDCLSNSTYFVSAILSVNLVNSLPGSCSVIKRLLVPIARQERFGEKLRDDLNADLQLTWDKPDCNFCETHGLMCGLESIYNNQVVCMSDYQEGTSRQGLKVFRIIALCITGPALIFVMLMASCVCYNDRIANITRNAASRSAPAAISPQPEVTIVTGLDELTIESYEKVVLGESRRVPGPNDGSCWICLSEYNSKETIRCIPECKHCFHADCIDEWLRMNVTCPVCRNSPAPSPLNVASSNV